MRFITLVSIGTVFCLGLASPLFSAESTPQPQRASGLTAVTMEHKLFADIKAAKGSGHDVSTAERYKAKGDAELREGKLHAAIGHYQQAEKALGNNGK